MIIVCPYCGIEADKPTGAVRRAAKRCDPIYCSRTCGGLARRKGKTKEQLVAEKSAYDREYREKNRQLLKVKKAEHFRKSYDPAVAKEKRKVRMPHHVAYCQRPEYRAWKKQYDRRYLAKKQFGDFAEVALILRDIEEEVASRISRYEIYLQNGTLNKCKNRRKQYESSFSHKPQDCALGNPERDQGGHDAAGPG